jgi:hypothetical protein
MSHALQQPKLQPPVTLAAIALHDWFERLLIRQGGIFISILSRYPGTATCPPLSTIFQMPFFGHPT